ncbi:MAG: hypothetical protein ABI658_28940 [Acidimicrobiales bacterium]
MMVAKATIVAGEHELPDDAHARIAAALVAEGEGERALFDREASAARAVAWLYRSAAPAARVQQLLGRIPGVRGLAIYEVEATDVHGAHHAPPPADERGRLHAVPGIRKVTFHRRLPDVTRDEYLRRFRWHGAIAEVHHSNAGRYRQNEVTNYIGPPERSADGVSEHWYASVDYALEHHFARADSPQVVSDDVAEWLDRSTAVGGYARVWHWS